MSLPYGFPKWAEGGFAIAKPVGLPRFSAPIPSTTTQYLMRQTFQQFKNQFAALALNTAHPDYATFYLVGEGELQDIGGGAVQWERTYAAVPASHDEYESFSYQFVGFMGIVWQGNWFGTAVTGRAPFARIVSSRYHHDYFLVGAGLTYATAGDIPNVLGQRYYSTSLLDPGTQVTYLADAYTIGSITFLATSPTATAYKALIAAGTEIVAEDSRLTRWQGNVWLRQTRYIIAA